MSPWDGGFWTRVTRVESGGAWLLALTTLGWLGCSGDDESVGNASPDGGGASAGAQGGASGSNTGGSSASASGGTGGAGGAAADAASGGGAPLDCSSEGAALSFDGVDDQVAMGQAPSLGLAQFTLEAWIKGTRGAHAGERGRDSRR